MLGLALLFFIVAIVAGVLGFTNIMVVSAGIAQIIFVVFLILFCIALILSLLDSLESSINAQLKGRTNMLGWVFAFLLVALLAGALGFSGIMVTAAGIAQIIFLVFLVFFVISLIIHLIKKSNMK